MEDILAEWEAFAADQLPAAASMKRLALRDHAKQILEAVAKDIMGAQTRASQVQKSKGQSPQLMVAAETAAQTHALLRARSGFDINQMAAEYRALRASVLRLWGDACKATGTDLNDMIRFNEAIDQALAESIAFFTAEVDQARNLLLGMLGHDMRNPLHAIQLTATYLAKLNAGAEVSAAAARLSNSSGRMKAMLDDLLDFNRTQLGLGINIAPSDIDLSEVFVDEIQQLRVAYPNRRIELEIAGELRGTWDGNRLHQLLGNLVSNALKYGASDKPVQVLLEGKDKEVIFAVTNAGPGIDPSSLTIIFDPLARGAVPEDPSRSDSSLGLGLYICREIATAHGGDIDVNSDTRETKFTVRLPRDGAQSSSPD